MHGKDHTWASSRSPGGGLKKIPVRGDEENFFSAFIAFLLPNFSKIADFFEKNLKTF